MVRTYFDIGGAEKVLPSLSQLVLQAQQLKRRMDRHTNVASVMLAGAEEYAEAVYDCQFEELRESFYGIVEKIENLGGLLRDVEEGVVDFHSRFEGQDIFLTWRLGERRIRHWRSEDDAPGERKRIVELK